MLLAGKGAFMKNELEARKLVNQMIEIGKLAGRETVCVLTDMDEPLGYAVGNTLEVIEAVQILKGKVIYDVEEVVLELGSYMLQLAGKGENIDKNKERLKENLQNGKAYQKFLELVENQGGDISYLENLEKFERANVIEPVISERTGYICEINAKEVGKLACRLGAGRLNKEDTIDLTVGIKLEKKIGDYVKEGEVLALIHAKNKENAIKVKTDLMKIIKLQKQSIDKKTKIIDVIR